MRSSVLRTLSAVPALLFAASFPALAADDGSLREWKSGSERSLLIEAYTSDARKGSPAAQRWISDLEPDPGLWTKMVPVVFSVDHGDKPGRWKDRFASREFTTRLLTYAAKWGVASPYVPTVVLNGIEWSGWARGDVLPAVPPEEVGVLRAQKTAAGEIVVRFDPVDTENKRWVAHGALLGFGIRVHADGGDNIGRNITHDFLTLVLTESPMSLTRDGDYRTILKLPSKAAVRTEALAAAIWVTRGENILPVQTVGGYIQKPPKKRPSKG